MENKAFSFSAEFIRAIRQVALAMALLLLSLWGFVFWLSYCVAKLPFEDSTMLFSDITMLLVAILRM